MRRNVLLRAAGAVFALGVVGLVFPTHRARAAWPPQPSDDFTNPANWPNDPGYAGRWNYWSFLPKQDQGTDPYLGADQKLGASGMSIDRAWALTTGSPGVRIAVLDSGIEWEQPDLANKAWLNAAELKGTARPQDKNGVVCGGTGKLAGYDCNADGVFNVADYRDDPRISPVVAGEKCLDGMDPAKPTNNDRILGDVNRNCILDAGDLIELFSDGTDDDANGYVDDIAGWDFYRNDNNPYDDTRYGHGTGEAKDSSAEGGNNQDSIGTCPQCMFIPLRVGDSFIADVNDFGKAVVYATDIGAKVVQEALGTLNQTAFSKAAIDYAYAHGVMIDASMADENSRHHNLPAVANHTLPVHSIRFNNDSYHNSSTFLAFDSCTNYGGHGALSVSGTSCASEATGRTAGIAGLVYSMGLSLPSPITLSAEEVMQVLKMSADDVDVPESRVVNPETGLGPFYESKPGWDQRFNYGRMNAFKAVSMVKEGRIPPEADIVSPTWYQPIYATRTSGPIPIFGRIAAARASSYDYVVEWGAGVQPDDSDFKTLVDVKNIPASTVSGGPTTPLATLDPRQIDTKHVADFDSPQMCNRDKTVCWGPNDQTVTLRVRVTAHYGSADVHGDSRRTISITNASNSAKTGGDDPDLLPGFPLDLGTSGEGGAKLADLDGDGVREIIFPASDGTIHAYTLRSGAPKELAGWPVRTEIIDGLNPAVTEPGVPSYAGGTAYVLGKSGGIDADIAREAIMSSPGIVDLDGDGKPEVVFTTWPGTLYVVDHAGKALPGWPKRLPLVPSCPLDPSKPKPAGDCMDLTHDLSRGTYASPVLVDMDKDGKPEIVQAAFDANIYVYKLDGSLLDGWPVRIHSDKTPKYNRIMTTPAAVDLNKDGIPELVTGSNEEVGGGNNTGPIFAVDGRGMKAPGGPYLPNWPIIRPSIHLFPVVGEGINASVAAADLDGDGVADLTIQGNAAPPLVVKGDPGPQSGFADPPNRLPVRVGNDPGFEATSIFGTYTRASQPDTFFPLFSVPSIGDLDQDGTPDVIMSGGSLSLIGSLAGGGVPRRTQHLLTAWSGKTGEMLPGMPVQLEDFQFLINHAVADLNGDDYPEVITGSGAYFVHAADACGREPTGWPKFTNGWIASSPAVGDITGDGNLDVVTATRDGFLFAWKTPASDKGVVQWASFHHDNQNTGNYGHALDQGVYEKASKVIDCTLPTAASPDELIAGGGCDCRTAGTDKSGMLFAVLGTLGLLVWRRRRSS